MSHLSLLDDFLLESHRSRILVALRVESFCL